jgi:cobalt-zinc-cadmium efflux system outer membrane protein
MKAFNRAMRLCVAFAAQGSGLLGQSAPEGDTLVVTLEEARTLAVRANPELLAASWRPTAARGDIRSARTLQFNPDVAFEARSPAGGFASRYEAELGLEIEIAGQRGLRIGASEASYQAVRSGFENEGRHVLQDVGRAYHGLVAAEQRLALAEEVDRLNAQLLEAVGTQRREGEVSLLEANLASVEAARARAGALEARSARTTAALELGRLIAIDPSVPLRTAGASSVAAPTGAERSSDERVQQAIARRPDLRAVAQDVERAREEERLARRESFPNLRVAGLATREDPLMDPRFGLAVGIEFPLFNRNQGLTGRRRAEIAEVEQLRRATELRVRVEVEDALRIYAAAQREVEILETEMLGPIRENQGLLEIAYREGKIDLATLLLLRNQLLDAELSYWAAWERREWARTDLESATGDILQGVDFIEGSDR